MNQSEKKLVASYFIVHFGFNDDGEYLMVKSKPILANDENEAGVKLKEQFEMLEGVPCDVYSIEKI